jgi:CRP/FNR family transcriptional regulator, anaerobic regulatory protein
MKLPVSLHDELALGQRKLIAIFGSSIPRILKAGEILGTTTSLNGGIFHLRTGWACRFPDLANSRRAIVDVYIPGDVIGLDALLRTRPLKNVLMLTSATAEIIPAEDGLMELMGNRSTALFVAWLLSERQRRTDRLLAAISGLNARGRIATIILDFHARLRRRRLIMGSTYNLPLTQVQIGQYLGLTVVHVNRVLQSLRAERILDLEKHCVTILDLDRLTSLTQSGGTGGSKTGVSDRPLDEAAN